MSRSSNTNANRKNSRTRSKSQRRLALAVLLVLLAAGAIYALYNSPFVTELRGGGTEQSAGTEDPGESGSSVSSGGSGESGRTGDISAIDESALPVYEGRHYVEINGSKPEFDETVYTEAGLVRDGSKWKTPGTIKGVDSNKLTPYEHYGELDNSGRCTVAYGCLGLETMPQNGESRGDISDVHPSGWAKAQNWERCHLIAWALGAENANDRNLITGTHYLNYDGMRPLEEETEHYIWRTGNHVLYMVKPYYKGDELIARGVQMTAWSVEDGGEGLSFNVYCFNVTPGAAIDYMSGIVTTAEQAAQEARLYVINTRSKVFHYPSCEGAQGISDRNREEVTATRLELTSQGYIPCGYCEP